MEDETRKPGAPSIYTQELIDEFCARVALGHSVRRICKADDMPAIATIFQWLRTKEGFAEQYARAKQEGADAIFEEMLDIADDGSNDYVEVMGKDGKTRLVLDKEAVQRSRLRVDTRKWVLGKIKPKVYGDNAIKIQALDKDGEPTNPGPGVDEVTAAVAAALARVSGEVAQDTDDEETGE